MTNLKRKKGSVPSTRRRKATPKANKKEVASRRRRGSDMPSAAVVGVVNPPNPSTKGMGGYVVGGLGPDILGSLDYGDGYDQFAKWAFDD
mgnify:CR=1 FL=1